MCDLFLFGLSDSLVLPLVFFPVFFVFIIGIRSFRERSAYRVSTLHHLGIMSKVDHDFGASPLCLP